MPLDKLLAGIKVSDLPSALDKLYQLAQRNSLFDLLDSVKTLQGIQKEIRQHVHREPVAEIQPVLEVRNTARMQTDK